MIIDSGYYSFEDGLSLDVDRVTVIGRGMEETILILRINNQELKVSCNFKRSNAKRLCNFRCQGHALKVIGAKGINMINLRTEWTGGPKSTNGAYGFYPVESEDVLIDGVLQ